MPFQQANAKLINFSNSLKLISNTLSKTLECTTKIFDTPQQQIHVHHLSMI